MHTIYWLSGESEGTTDELPSDWFYAEGERPFLVHDVIGLRGGKSIARCSLSVKGTIADLDYGGAHAAYNESHAMLRGVMRLMFEDDCRVNLKGVQWREEGERHFDICEVQCARREPQLGETLAPFDPIDLEDGRQKIERMVVLRQGQATFRRDLMEAYEGRCAITGCQIDDVLEAAHISPYLGVHTNHVTNGLLVRADIHTLFDRGLIKVGPGYLIWADDYVLSVYNLPASVTLPRNPTLWPSRDALALKSKG